jgi:PAS domain S-box-containing protein
LARDLRKWALGLAGYALAGGAVSLAGWALDLPRLTQWDHSGISIQPNTAFAVICAASGLILLQLGYLRVSAVLGGFVAAFGAAVLFQWITGVSLGFDGLLLFGRTWGRVGAMVPGRTGPPGATSLMLLGLAIVLATRGPRARAVTPVLALVTAGIALLSLIGYAYGADVLYTLPQLTIIALQTTTFIMALSVGLMLSVPERSPVRRLVEDSAAGTLVRRALPIVVLLPVALGLLRLLGQRAGLYDLAFGTAIRTVVEIILLGLLLWWTSGTIARQERRAAERRQATRTNEQRLAGLLGSMSDAFMTFDRGWRFTFINDEAVSLLRKPRAEVLGKNVWEVYPESVGTVADLRLHEAMEERRTVEYEFFFEPWGRWFFGKAYPIGDGGVALFCRDTTERRETDATLARSEQSARDREQMLAKVTENTKVGLVVISAEHRYLYANQAYAKVLGLDEQELVGRHIGDVLPAAYADQIRLPLERSFAGERVEFDLTLPPLIEGGPPRWFAVIDEPQWRDGTVESVSVTVVDLTDRKALEEERDRLLQSERLARGQAERASEVKDEFLATLSHELRTPLNAILGWVRLLEKRPSDSALAAEAIEVIARNARAQADLIADLLDMNRIISGKIRLEVEDVRLSEVVEAAIDSVRPAAESKQVGLHAVLSPLADHVRGDASRLQQVMWNVLSNAVKFTPKGGRIHVMLMKSESYAEIVVSDTGSGIDPRFLPHVFDRFRQGDASTTREHGGLGLGLAIVKQLVELHGGTVRADSGGVDQGATFTITLPLALMHRPRLTPPAGSAARPRLLEDVDLEGITVLAVEDQQDARDLLRIVLERSRAHVITAGSVDEALSVLESARPAIILCDIGMPGRDGYDFIAELRRRNDDTPALAVTAFARTEDKIRALRAGYHGHIAKPIEPAELLSTVAVLAKSTRH